MAIKLDTSSPQQQLLPQGSFDPLPGVTDLDAGASRAYQSLAQTAGQVANKLQQTKDANQKLLVNEARYAAMGQMENDYRVIDDVIRNNKGGADELLIEFNNKYKELDLNSFLPEDEKDKITDLKLSRNILGELNYRYGGYANKLETLGTNVSFTNRKVNHVKETNSKFNEFYTNNPIVSNSNELEFQTLIKEMYDPEADNIEPYFSGSATAEQRTAFTNPQRQSLTSNMSNYLADSPTIEILEEREQYAREIFNEYGTAYNLDVSDIDTSTLRKNIVKQEEENAQARIDELLNPLEGSFTAIGKNPGYEDFYNNVGRILEVTKDIHPSLMKYATDKQLAKINKINNYMMLLTPPTDEEGNVVGIAPMQEILMHSTLSDDTDYALNQLAEFGFTEEELKEVNGFVNTVRANITEAEKNNRTDYYRYIFPQYANFIDQRNWADAQTFYEQNILGKEISINEETGDVIFYGDLKKLPKYVGDFRPLFDMPEKGIYDEETLTNNILQLQLANEGNTNFASAAQYLINGEGGYTLSAQQAIVAELVAGTQNDSEAIAILGPKLVSIEGNYPEATIAQIKEIRKAMSDNAEDDYDFRFFKDKSNVIQDLHYAVEATENAKNTSKYNFYNTLLNNLIAQGITDNKSVDQIQLDVSAFADDYVTPTFGRYAVFEHDDRNLEVQLHPDALELMDPEMPRGNYYRGFNEAGKNIFQKEFSTRAADDVSESVFNAVFAFSYAFHELETKGMYEAMGTDPMGGASFEDIKSRQGFAAFVDGSVKNTFVPDQFQTFLGGPMEGYEGRNVAKVVRRGDYYIPMYYDKSALKYTEFTDRNGVPVMAPVDRVHSAVRSYNIEKNKMSQIQVVDVMGPWKKKTSFFMQYFGPGIPRNPGSSEAFGTFAQ